MSRPLALALWVSRGSPESPWRRWGPVLRQPQSYYAARSVKTTSCTIGSAKTERVRLFDCSFQSGEAISSEPPSLARLDERRWRRGVAGIPVGEWPNPLAQSWLEFFQSRCSQRGVSQSITFFSQPNITFFSQPIVPEHAIGTRLHPCRHLTLSVVRPSTE